MQARPRALGGSWHERSSENPRPQPCGSGDGWASYTGAGTLAALSGVQMLARPVDGDAVTITIDVRAGWTVRDWAAFKVHFAKGDALDGKTIMLRAGGIEYVNDALTSWWGGKLKAWTTTGLAIRPDRDDVLPPVIKTVGQSINFNCINTANVGPLRIENLWFYRGIDRSLDERPITISANSGVNAMLINGAAGTFSSVIVRGCEFYSDITTPAGAGGYAMADVTGLAMIGAKGAAADAIQIVENTFRHLSNGLFLKGIENARLRDNYLHHLFNDFVIWQGAKNVSYTAAVHIDPMGWYGWLHQDMSHMQDAGTIDGLLIEGAAILVGDGLRLMRGEWSGRAWKFTAIIPPMWS